MNQSVYKRTASCWYDSCKVTGLARAAIMMMASSDIVKRRLWPGSAVVKETLQYDRTLIALTAVNTLSYSDTTAQLGRFRVKISNQLRKTVLSLVVMIMYVRQVSGQDSRAQ